MPVKIFFCYAHEDEALLNKLKTHLRPLQRQGLIDVWHDRDISAGTEWGQEISKHLNTADIILLLISPAFMDSDYCYSVEMKQAIERQESGEARVISIILEYVCWQVEPLRKLQVLPYDARPIVSAGWHSINEALYNVIEGIQKVVNEFEKVEDDAFGIKGEQTRQREEKQGPITEIAELRASIYSDKAEDAINNGDWERAETKTRQALDEDPRLNLRRKLGLSISNTNCQTFIKKHRRDGSIPFIPLTSTTSYSPALIEKAIFWLKEAQKHGEDQDGAVSAALAQLYGINKKYGAMHEALTKAISTDIEWKEQFRRPDSLILIANGCSNEPNIQDTLGRLRKDLGLLSSEETFTHYIKERYGKIGYSLYWAIGRPNYWIEHKESMPDFPLDILVVPYKDGDIWQAEASYVVPGNRVYIPNQEGYLPVHDLYNQLEERFFLICPCD